MTSSTDSRRNEQRRVAAIGPEEAFPSVTVVGRSNSSAALLPARVTEDYTRGEQPTEEQWARVKLERSPFLRRPAVITAEQFDKAWRALRTRDFETEANEYPQIPQITQSTEENDLTR